MRVAIVERLRFGGTCVNTGCIPTKAMVASAYAIHTAGRGEEYGFRIPGEVVVDFPAVMARKERISAQSRTGVEQWLRGMQGCTVYQGHARFESPRSIRVSDEQLTAERIFLNVGGRAVVPNLPGLADVPYLTNSSMMNLRERPDHLIVVGGSYIGLEFGQMFRRFGSRVTILEAGPRLIQREDEDVSAAILDILRAEDIDVRLSAKCIRLARQGGEVVASADCTNGPPEIAGTHLLLAVGRQPNTSELGLENAGIHTDARGYIPVDDQLQTESPGIWALGDCNGKGAFTHTSYNDYEIVAANLLDGGARRVSDRITAYNLYIDPPLGRAGATDIELRRSGKNVLVAKRPMTRVGRAVEKGESQGFMKIAVDADTKQILGAAILGPGGDEVIHTVLDVMYAKAPYTVMQRAMHIHPTVAELLPTILGELGPLN
jgi:pyruvate/2-oxoglutarate dehydrogenase complex dihydrolipoamide dehydrogenase (E3) component